MSAVFRRTGCLVLVWAAVSGCAPLARFEDTEELALRTAAELRATQEDGRAKHAMLQGDIARLKNRLEGVSATVVRVPAGGVATAVFGNQSGQNAAATITHRTEDYKGPGTFIRIVRIKRPSEEHAAPVVAGASAPDFTGTESTVWLELSSAGSRRQVVVPCGYQVEAKSPNGAALDLLLTYHNKECR